MQSLADNLPPEIARQIHPDWRKNEAVGDLSCQGHRLGELLLFHFLEMACAAAEKIGILAVDLFSKDDQAKRFYLKYGFLTLQDDPLHLHLPLTTVRAMFEQGGAPPTPAPPQPPA
jgi:hypothetical protein